MPATTTPAAAMESGDKVQIFVRYPSPSHPCRAISANRSATIGRIKLAALSPNPPAPQTLAALALLFSGKPLPDSATLLSAGVPDLATLSLHFPLRGGGGDGGATGAESRDCYLKMYAEKKPDKVDPNEARLSRWSACALSARPLDPPLIADKLGNVFNKQPLVETLISKKLPKEFAHIKGLKDMIPIELSVIPGKGLREEISFETRFQCPISGLEFNGKYKFVVLKGCGHVVSAKALKEVKTSTCLVCHREFSDSDKMVINGDKEEVAELRARMEEEKGSKEKEKGKRGRSGRDGVALGKEGGGKKFKVVDLAPANATKEVFASIFTSSSKKGSIRETYSCRSLPLGRN